MMPSSRGRIAFSSDREGDDEIYVMNADGSRQVRLTHNPADDSGPAWSPVGARIAFYSYRDGSFGIYVIDADGTGLTRLTDSPARDTAPVWSP